MVYEGKIMKLEEYGKLNWKGILERVGDDDCQWDYVTALRGPDDGESDLYKRLFTSFIRGGLNEGGEFSYFDLDYCLSILKVNTATQLVSRLKEVKPDSHYICHLHDALSKIIGSFDGEVSEFAGLLRRVLYAEDNGRIECIRDLKSIVNKVYKRRKYKRQKILGI